MNKKLQSRTAKSISAFILSLSFFLLAPLNLMAQTAMNFTLQDQFGNEIAVKFPSNRPVVLVFGDRDGSKQVEGWVRPIYNKFSDQVYIFGIAELSAVPSVARPVVRRLIKSKSKNPIMLDWKGDVSEGYGYEKEKANVFVISKNGKITAVKRGAASASALEDVYGEIRKNL
jgi:AhpC/TSA family